MLRSLVIPIYDIKNILTNLRFEDRSRLENKQIEILMSLQHKGESLLCSKRSELVYEFVGVINHLKIKGEKDAVEIVINEIQEIQSKPYRLVDLYYELSVFTSAKKSYNRDVARLRDQVKVDEGIEECKRCHSIKTITILSQTRSADEGQTSKSVCHSCGHKWVSSN
jgi:DNA-directed RNA polymerase subunit M/transcription elongation factor TFIIS